MIVAAVDSAELSGLAVIARDPLAGTERLLWHDAATIRGANDVVEAVDALALWRPEFLVVEEPFAHPRNPITGMTLARLFGRWAQVAETRGFAVIGVPASMWQPAVLPGFSPRMRSIERKAAAIRLTQERFGVEVSADEADAVGLALYAARNVRMRGTAA